MNVTDESAFQLLRIFMRLEFALEQFDEFIRGAENEPAFVQWSRFDSRLRQLPPAQFWDHVETGDRRTLLGTETGGPPEKLRVRVDAHGQKRVQFEPAAALTPELIGVMDACRRVRNNLVHGGKERYEQQRPGYPGHDQALVDAASRVMDQASRAIPDIARLCWD